MSIIRKSFTAAAGLLLAGGLGLAASAAQAGVSGSPDFTNANANPVSGYYAFNAEGATFTHVNAYVGLQYASDQLQPFPLATLPPVSGESNPITTTADGAGVQLCNDNTGTAIQAGAVYLGGGKFAVLWGVGTFEQTPADTAVQNNGDACEDGLLVNPDVTSGTTEIGSVNSALDAVPYLDTVEVNILYNNSGKTLAGCPFGDDAEVEASNITTGDHSYDACIPKSVLGPHAGFDEAADGVESDTTDLSAPAGIQLDGNAHWTLTDVQGDHGFGDTSPDWTAVPADSTGTGVGPAGESLLRAGAISNGNWSAFEGTPTG